MRHTDTAVSLDDVTYLYNKDTPLEKVGVRGLTLSIRSGEFVAVTGGAGSGKSTLMQLMGGMLKPSSGSISVSLPTDQRRLADVGVAFQFPEKQFFEETIYSDLAFPLRKAGLPEVEIGERIRYALDLVDMDSGIYGSRAPLELSSGEKRRAAMAAILVLDPGIIVLDEPVAGLDCKGRRDILAELQRLVKETGKTVIIATRDLEAAFKVSDRVAFLEGGNVLWQAEGDVLRARLAEVLPVSRLLRALKRRGLDLGQGISDLEDVLRGIKTALTGRKKLLTEGG